MEVWKINFLSKWASCRFHVNLPLCLGPLPNGRTSWLIKWGWSYLLTSPGMILQVFQWSTFEESFSSPCWREKWFGVANTWTYCQVLGGGFKHGFYFYLTWGDDSIWIIFFQYFSDGLVQPPTFDIFWEIHFKDRHCHIAIMDVQSTVDVINLPFFVCLDSLSIPIGSMGLVYLPTWMVDLYGKCS